MLLGHAEGGRPHGWIACGIAEIAIRVMQDAATKLLMRRPLFSRKMRHASSATCVCSQTSAEVYYADEKIEFCIGPAVYFPWALQTSLIDITHIANAMNN